MRVAHTPRRRPSDPPKRRHIRLKKGFNNEEVMDGVVKLRIPDVLLKEKIRTQSRFDVSLARAPNIYAVR